MLLLFCVATTPRTVEFYSRLIPAAAALNQATAEYGFRIEDPEIGVIRHDWNDHGFGTTGRYGFDVFRWKWTSYHLEGVSWEYQVRWGDTIETIVLQLIDKKRKNLYRACVHTFR